MALAYHPGELAVQHRAGVADAAARSARAIRAEVPDAARSFLREQTFVIAGWTDLHERVWCTLLAGDPGFLHAPDGHTVLIAALPDPADPVAGLLDGDQLGLLAIEPASRRRMRVNGTAFRSGGGLHVAVDQVVANCPKYITARVPGEPVPGAAVDEGRANRLSDDDRALIAAADVFYVATAMPGRGPADASHRGGNPGFVEVHDASTVVWPDYVGNSMFLTLGNLEVNPRAGLLFVDWSNRTVLQLTGVATTDWAADATARRPGAERLVRFEVHEVRRRSLGPGVSWRLVELSRFNPPVR